MEILKRIWDSTFYVTENKKVKVENYLQIWPKISVNLAYSMMTIWEAVKISKGRRLLGS